MDERATHTTASHLRIVQDAVRDFVVALSENIEERVELLEQKKLVIQNEIDALLAGVVTQFRRIRTKKKEYEKFINLLPFLQAILDGSKMRIRLRDKELRLDMISGAYSRGEVLLSLMEKEQLLAQSDAGSAFDGFC